MPEIFTPMSPGDAICWEALMLLAGIIGFLVLVFTISAFFILLLPLALLIMALKHWAKGELGPAAAYGIAFCLVGLPISYCVGRGAYEWKMTDDFKKQIIHVTPVGSSWANPHRRIFETRDGQSILAETEFAAGTGHGRVLTTKDKRGILEGSISSQIVSSAQEYRRRWPDKPRPIDDEFIRCRLSLDLRRLQVTVNPRWGKYTREKRIGAALRFYRYFKDGLGWHWRSNKGDLYVRVFDTNRKLLAYARPDSSEKSFSWVDNPAIVVEGRTYTYDLGWWDHDRGEHIFVED